MSQQDFFNLLSLSALQKRIYAALVRKAALLPVTELVNRIRATELMEGVDPSDYKLSSYLDALCLKMTPEDFSDFLAGF